MAATLGIEIARKELEGERGPGRTVLITGDGEYPPTQLFSPRAIITGSAEERKERLTN